jgi:hypothetical protein
MTVDDAPGTVTICKRGRMGLYADDHGLTVRSAASRARRFAWAAGGGKGRARPWRATMIGISLAAGHDDPEAELASGALLNEPKKLVCISQPAMLVRTGSCPAPESSGRGMASGTMDG